MDKLHHSKVDNWLLMLVVTAAVLVLLAATLLSLMGWAWFGLLLFVAGAVLPMWVVMTTRYHVINDELVVRAGPLRWRIALDQVLAAEACHNALLAPAMSKERLAITYQDASGKRATLMISPEDRYQFIFDLGVAEPEYVDGEL